MNFDNNNEHLLGTPQPLKHFASPVQMEPLKMNQENFNNNRFNKRCKNANLIFCKSHNMYNAIPKKYRDNAMLFTDVAVELKEFEESEE